MLTKPHRTVLLLVVATCLSYITSVANAKSIGVNFVSELPPPGSPQTDGCCALDILEVAGVQGVEQGNWNNTELQPTTQGGGQPHAVGATNRHRMT